MVALDPGAERRRWSAVRRVVLESIHEPLQKGEEARKEDAAERNKRKMMATSTARLRGRTLLLRSPARWSWPSKRKRRARVTMMNREALRSVPEEGECEAASIRLMTLTMKALVGVGVSDRAQWRVQSTESALNFTIISDEYDYKILVVMGMGTTISEVCDVRV